MITAIEAGLIIFMISLLLSVFGKGGGEFYVPILLAIGTEFQTAATTSLFLLMITGFTMTVIFGRKALIDWRTGGAVVLASASGSFTGGLISSGIPPFALKITFAVLLMISAVFIQHPPSGKGKVPGPAWKRIWKGEEYEIPVMLFPIIFLTGFTAGMVGISGGGLIVPLLIIMGMPVRIAFSTNAVMVLFASTMGFMGHGLSSGVRWEFVAITGLFALAGATIGSTISTRLNVSHLKRYFVLILLVAAIWMIFNALGSY